MTKLHVVEQGGGQVETGAAYTLSTPPAEQAQYVNAMLTSYRTRSDFSFTAGSRLDLTAQFAGELRGTAGFGFWNHPYGMGYRFPRAVWFFFSAPPNNMPLALGVAGSGFKAAVFDAQRLPFYLLAPFALPGFLAMRIPALYRILWPIGQRALGVDEFALDAGLLASPRRYGIDWQQERVDFSVDGQTVFSTSRVPRGKLGFVAWVDNQYAVVTPQGWFEFGLTDAPSPQQLKISDVVLTGQGG